MPLELRLMDKPNAHIEKVGGKAVVVPSNDMVEGVYFVEIPAHELGETKTTLVLGVFSNGELIEKVKTSFLGPIKTEIK